MYTPTVAQQTARGNRPPSVIVLSLATGNRCVLAFRGPHEGDGTWLRRPSIAELTAVARAIAPGGIEIHLGEPGSARRVVAAVLRETVGRAS